MKLSYQKQYILDQYSNNKFEYSEYKDLVHQFPKEFSKNKFKPVNSETEAFDRNLIFCQAQEKHQGKQEYREEKPQKDNPFFIFSGDLKNRRWYFKDDKGQNQGPHDSQYMEGLRKSKKINEDTKISFDSTEKFVRLAKVLQKLKDQGANVQNVNETSSTQPKSSEKQKPEEVAVKVQPVQVVVEKKPQKVLDTHGAVQPKAQPVVQEKPVKVDNVQVNNVQVKRQEEKVDDGWTVITEKGEKSSKPQEKQPKPENKKKEEKKRTDDSKPQEETTKKEEDLPASVAKQPDEWTQVPPKKQKKK